MAQPVVTLLSSNLKAWFSAKGFAMVTVAALLPLALTGAWLATHTADVAASTLTPDGGTFTEGDVVNLTGVVENVGKETVGPFNATLSVGRVFGTTLVADETNATEIERLAPGDRRELKLSWTAKPGVYWALVEADTGDKVGEIEEFNNQKPAQLTIRYRLPTAEEGPNPPENLTGNPEATDEADVAIQSLSWSPETLNPGDNATLDVVLVNHGPATLDNASVELRVGRVFDKNLVSFRQTQEDVTLEPGATKTVTLSWRAQEGTFWVESYVNVTGQVRDGVSGNNHAAKPFAVGPRTSDAKPPPPPEKITIKDFYLDILDFLHLRILIPFIGLFYAAGVLADERERGTLVHLLTRPIARWLIPLTKFVASFAVASVAVLAGIVAAFALLFGTPRGDIGFLTTPILISLLSLFVYGSFFILIGVLTERPYLVGVAFVLGWETVAGNFVPWVENLTIRHFLVDAIRSWPLDQGVQWLPAGEEGVRALWIALLMGLGFLVAASAIMRRREFDV